MEKQELLRELRARVARGEITPDEMRTLLDVTEDRRLRSSSDERMRASDDGAPTRVASVLFHIGGAVVAMGILVLAGTMDEGLRALLALGAGVVAFQVGLFATRRAPGGDVGSTFLMIAGLVLPGALTAAFHDFGFGADAKTAQIVIHALLTGVFLAAFIWLRSDVLLTFAILFATCLFLAIALPGSFDSWEDPYGFFFTLMLIIGAAYIVLGAVLARTRHERIRQGLYTAGVAAVLVAGLALGRWEPRDDRFWQLIYPGIVFAVIVWSTFTKNSSCLALGALALVAYIIKITTEHFSDSLGWPLSLVVIGLSIMGVTFMALRLKRRLLSR